MVVAASATTTTTGGAGGGSLPRRKRGGTDDGRPDYNTAKPTNNLLHQAQNTDKNTAKTGLPQDQLWGQPNAYGLPQGQLRGQAKNGQLNAYNYNLPQQKGQPQGQQGQQVQQGQQGQQVQQGHYNANLMQGQQHNTPQQNQVQQGVKRARKPLTDNDIVKDVNRYCRETSDSKHLKMTSLYFYDNKFEVSDYTPLGALDDFFYQKFANENISLYMRRGLAVIYGNESPASGGSFNKNNNNNNNNINPTNNTNNNNIIYYDVQRMTVQTKNTKNTKNSQIVQSYQNTGKGTFNRRSYTDKDAKNILFILAGLPKFGYSNDQLTQQPSGVTTYKYFQKPGPSNEFRFSKRIFTIKENGNAAHLGFFEYENTGYAVIGSKNVHIIIDVSSKEKMTEDITSKLNTGLNKKFTLKDIVELDQSKFKTICDQGKAKEKIDELKRCYWANRIAALLILNHGDKLVQYGDLYNKFIGTSRTMVFEAIFDDHLVDYKGFMSAKFFAITTPQYADVNTQGLCAVTPLDAETIIREAGLDFVDYDVVINDDSFEDTAKKIGYKHQIDDNSEGSVVYDIFINKDGTEIVGRLFKHKNFTYIIHRKARELICNKSFRKDTIISLCRDLLKEAQVGRVDDRADLSNVVSVDDLDVEQKIIYETNLVIEFNKWQNKENVDITRENFKTQLNEFRKKVNNRVNRGLNSTANSGDAASQTSNNQYVVKHPYVGFGYNANPDVQEKKLKYNGLSFKTTDAKNKLEYHDTMINRTGGKNYDDVAIMLIGLQGSGKSTLRTVLRHAIQNGLTTYANQDELATREKFLEKLWDYPPDTILNRPFEQKYFRSFVDQCSDLEETDKIPPKAGFPYEKTMTTTLNPKMHEHGANIDYVNDIKTCYLIKTEEFTTAAGHDVTTMPTKTTPYVYHVCTGPFPDIIEYNKGTEIVQLERNTGKIMIVDKMNHQLFHREDVYRKYRKIIAVYLKSAVAESYDAVVSRYSHPTLRKADTTRDALHAIIERTDSEFQQLNNFEKRYIETFGAILEFENKGEDIFEFVIRNAEKIISHMIDLKYLTHEQLNVDFGYDLKSRTFKAGNIETVIREILNKEQERIIMLSNYRMAKDKCKKYSKIAYWAADISKHNLALQTLKNILRDNTPHLPVFKKSGNYHVTLLHNSSISDEVKIFSCAVPEDPTKQNVTNTEKQNVSNTKKDTEQDSELVKFYDRLMNLMSDNDQYTVSVSKIVYDDTYAIGVVDIDETSRTSKKLRTIWNDRKEFLKKEIKEEMQAHITLGTTKDDAPHVKSVEILKKTRTEIKFQKPILIRGAKIVYFEGPANKSAADNKNKQGEKQGNKKETKK